MTSAELEALRLEEQAVLDALARAMTALAEAHQALGLWITLDARKGRPPTPPPRDVNQAALNLQLEVMALYRLRLWRNRFG